jgi:hypothetical protein
VFVVFLAMFGVLLKMSKLLSGALSAMLGGACAAGAWMASGYLPAEVPIVVANPIRTDAFWDVAARSGVDCVVIDAAMAWDRPPVENARVLGGLGVPDVRGKNGDWFVYTTDELQFERPPEGAPTSTAGTIFRVDERDGKIETRLYGPQNFWKIDSLRARVASLEEKLQVTEGFRASQKIRDEKNALQDGSRLGARPRRTSPKASGPAGSARFSSSTRW